MAITVGNWGRINHNSPLGSTLSRFINYIVDWLRSHEEKFDKIKKFEDAEKYLNTPSDVNAFLIKDFEYAYDVKPEDRWRTPKSFFYHRDSSGKIRDDCEGCAWFSHHVTRKGGLKENNYIFCMYNDYEGHATNWHGPLDRKKKVAQYFIPDASLYSVFVENEEGTEVEMIESGELEFDESIKQEVRKRFSDITPDTTLVNMGFEDPSNAYIESEIREWEKIALSTYKTLDGKIVVDSDLLKRYFHGSVPEIDKEELRKILNIEQKQEIIFK